MIRRLLLVVAILAASPAACNQAPEAIEYEIVGTFPHDTSAFTQGLLFHDRHLYESTGQYGFSSLRRVDPATGRVVDSVLVDSAYFAEGLAVVGSDLVQLTWKAGIAFVYDLETLEAKGEHRYSGQGWGLCFDGTSLFMSNGSAKIVARDPATFEVRAEIEVKQDGVSVSRLNELECVGEYIYANVLLGDRIVRIDKESGQVTGEIDGRGLSAAGRRPTDSDAVLNGIAYIEETDVLLVTGKLWPTILALRMKDE